MAMKMGFRGGVRTVLHVLLFFLCWRFYSPTATAAISAATSVAGAMAAAATVSGTAAFDRERNEFCPPNFKGMTRRVAYLVVDIRRVPTSRVSYLVEIRQVPMPRL